MVVVWARLVQASPVIFGLPLGWRRGRQKSLTDIKGRHLICPIFFETKFSRGIQQCSILNIR